LNDKDAKEIDDILDRAASAPHPVDPALLDRVSASIGASLHPVRPIAPAWKLAVGLLSIWAGIVFVSASALGMSGIHKLNGAEMGTIFSALAIFTCLAALVSVAAMTPGGVRWRVPGNPAMLLLAIMTAWIAVDAILFHDYQMGSFVAEGIPCLRAGLAVAVPTGVAAWLVLRRGFAVNAAGAGLAAGTLAGLAGLAMLEMHCPNLHAMHIMVWHTAVIPVSAITGAVLAGMTRQH
jgi:hypothetical protein